MDFSSSIKKGISSGNGKAILYGSLIGLVASDIIPTPADAAYFYWERKLRDNWNKGVLTAGQYARRELIIYYGLNPIYWVIIGGLVIMIKGDVSKKLKIGISIIGAGAVIGVVYKNYQKDKLEEKKPISI